MLFPNKYNGEKDYRNSEKYLGTCGWTRSSCDGTALANCLPNYSRCDPAGIRGAVRLIYTITSSQLDW